jgi:hypothetical protein
MDGVCYLISTLSDSLERRDCLLIMIKCSTQVQSCLALYRLEVFALTGVDMKLGLYLLHHLLETPDVDTKSCGRSIG